MVSKCTRSRSRRTGIIRFSVVFVPFSHFSISLNMTANSGLDSLQTSPRWSQIGFYMISVLFNLCLMIQVFTVGLAYFYSPGWWNAHVWLVRGYSGLSLILLGWAFLVPFSSRIRGLTASLPALLGLQFFTIHVKTPLHLDVLHPLIGFTLFLISSTLVHRVWRSLSAKDEPT